MRNLTQISIIVCFLFLLGIEKSYADHLYGGYFTYTKSGDTIHVELVTYTDSHDDESDRDSVEINWGDNIYEYLPRVNNGGDGLVVYDGLKYNVYRGTHLYNRDGVFQLTLSDNFRAEDIQNMSRGASGLTILYITTLMPVGDSLQFCQNQGIQATVIPDFKFRTGDNVDLNFGIFDPDGDSLNYSLVPSRVKNGQTAPGYRIPNDAQLEPSTGSFLWQGIDHGKWLFTMQVDEYRNGNLIGQTLLDFLIEGSDFEDPNVSGNVSKQLLNLSNKDSLTFEFNQVPSDSIWVVIPSDSLNSLFSTQVSYTLSDPDEIAGKVVFTPENITGHNGLVGATIRVYWKFGILTGYRDYSVNLDFPKKEQETNCQIQDLDEVEEIIPALETFQIAPSLFDDAFWLNVGDDWEGLKVNIFDMRGRIIARYENLDQSTFKVAISTLRPAVYFVVAYREDDMILSEKVVKR